MTQNFFLTLTEKLASAPLSSIVSPMRKTGVRLCDSKKYCKNSLRKFDACSLCILG